MKRMIVYVLMFTMFSFSYDAFARPKSKKNREKDHPNYQRYNDDEEYRSGRSSRLGGILLASIGGGIGGAAFIGGLVWNTCVGATKENRPQCKRNAREAMAAGLIIGGGSLGAGIPMIAMGREEMDRAKSRIDGKYPVKEEDSSEEASVLPRERSVSSQNPFDGMSLAVRVVNIEF